MVTNQINCVLKQAVTTFTSKKDNFLENLELLKVQMDKITASDVNLPPQFMSEQLWKKRNKAPVTCIDVYEDDNFSVGIFILKPGMKLPLHDHPHMFGLIKVIAGKVKITSFSLHTEAIKTSVFGSENVPHTKLVVVEKNQQVEVDCSAETCILEPDKGNLHEIESIDGPAAFLDILSPPYGTNIPNNGPRHCNYYRILKEVASNIFLLEKTPSPSWYWNDTFPYTGPELSI